MIEFEALEKWLADWKEGRIQYLDKLQTAFNIWSAAHATAFNDHWNRKEIEVKDWSPRKGQFTKTVKAVSVLIGGEEYLDYGYEHPGQTAYFKACGLGEISNQDEQLVKYYKRDERIKKVEKEVEYKRKTIVERVKKICTEDIVEVAEVAGDGIFIRGANGKVAHMWAIFAGGYNIQCLHIRVLVKESMWLEKKEGE